MPAARTSATPLGVVYTPRAVTGPMVRLALEPLVRGKAAAEILALRVCDPAVGEGAFVVEVIDYLAHAVVAARGGDIEVARREVAQHCIVGIDIDGRAIATSRLATGIATERATGSAETSGSALLVGDALAFDWAAAYPDGFDAVIGNPPYIRQERLAAKDHLRGFASYSGVADLYVYFIELAHRLLRPAGRWCFVVPSKWLTVAYGRGLRGFLSDKRTVEGVVDFARSRLFPADAYPCIVWGAAEPAKAPVVTTRAEPDEEVGAALARAKRELASRSTLSVDDELASTSPFRTDEPWHIDMPAERALLERLEREFPPLAAYVTGRPSRGVVTGCNRAFVLDRAQRDALIAAEPAAAAIVRPFVKGRDLAALGDARAPGVGQRQPRETERFILLVDRGTSLAALPRVRAHLEQFREALEPRPPGATEPWSGRKPGTYRWYELQDPVGPLVHAKRARILYQDIQTSPLAVLDRDGELVPDTTVWMLPTDDAFVLAVLSSRLYGWYAKRRFPPALNGAVRPKAAYLRRLPLPTPTDAMRRAPDVNAAYRLTAAEATLIATTG